MGIFHAIGNSGDRRHIVANCGIDIYVNPEKEFEFIGKNLQFAPVQDLVEQVVDGLAQKLNIPAPVRIYLNSGLIFSWLVLNSELDNVLRALADLLDSEDFQSRLAIVWPSNEKPVDN